MIRVVLPPHLRNLAQVTGEVAVEVQGKATPQSVLDALESRYPVLRGAIVSYFTSPTVFMTAVTRVCSSARNLPNGSAGT